jgi:hypothetical protein
MLGDHQIRIGTNAEKRAVIQADPRARQMAGVDGVAPEDLSVYGSRDLLRTANHIYDR